MTNAPTILERFRAIGARDTGRCLSLLSEVLRPFSEENEVVEAAIQAASMAADPDLFFLNLSRLGDSVSIGFLTDSLRDAELRILLGALLGGSEFLPERLANRPEVFKALFPEKGVLLPLDSAALHREALEEAKRCDSEEEMKRALRRMKLREMSRIAARDLGGLSSLSQVTEELSSLASAALDGAVRFARKALSDKFGEPMSLLPDGTRQPCRFVVLGMGKLGGLELNFSSDVDLVYLYEADRWEAQDGKKSLSPHQYFVRVGEAVTRIMQEPTDEGFVFRVDLRLRPEGTRGELAISQRAAEIYYESFGQTWERAALIKARPVAGDISLGEEFLRTLVPFVFRKYMDFTSIVEIKEMKDRINQAAIRGCKGERDLKLGAGGIREIEFFVQAHQLIYGGKEPSLRLRGTLEALEALLLPRLVTEREREELAEAYVFLRTLEHRIQVYQERQTHVLPRLEDDQWRLARAMKLADPQALLEALDARTDAVCGIYSRLFGAGRQEIASGVPPEIQELFLPGPMPLDASERLSLLGFKDAEIARKNLEILRDGPPRIRISQRARQYLNRIAPKILHCATKSPDSDMALVHMERFLSAVGARTMFYALLFEKPKVIESIVRLFGSSRYLSGILLRHPELLDTFLRTDLDVPFKSKSDMRTRLASDLEACSGLEDELDVLRRFKNLETLRVGIHDMGGALSIEEGMVQLSSLADALLTHALAVARREVRYRFGVPIDAETGLEASFAVMGLGKLGAEELSYHSDLDIIFLYSGAGESAPDPDGQREFRKISNQEYFAKVAQRLISVLTTMTREGYVYRLDTRLRPSGNAGTLVTSLEAFQRYHDGAAQLWERQALLRCRFVTGNREFGKKVEELAKDIIFGRPLPSDTAEEIHRLRTRMEVELGRESEDRLNLKVGRGGVVDVEFAVQYLQLLYGAVEPCVRARSTLKALYELRRSGIIPADQFKALDDGYRFLRSLDARLRISHDSSIDQFDPNLLEPETVGRYRKETGKIRKVYLELLGLPEPSTNSDSR
ncbi:MAG: bifunctional [glutamate--ammonia ligase]-adenylyl-L-tyrosine phosphorylase/[glutamate--ammonia-ligase] adenylyltransferase [Syntrophorhabdaceae bacterium]|nr:bifunctional [glutamate--ammonia ligase]-adenylyl-L-tyrosine phosphorylase/[glutamate--ammonia-ligase] adenylyltransferase [Syntrophorhabdaceae bacterium]